jgi:hypothetical protein
MTDLPDRTEDVQPLMDGLQFSDEPVELPPTSTLVREWMELELSALEQDQPISRADALRALAALRPLGGAA